MGIGLNDDPFQNLVSITFQIMDYIRITNVSY